MHKGSVWELPFDQPAVLEVHAEFGTRALLPVEPGYSPRLEIARGGSDNIEVRIEKLANVVRVSLDPMPALNWFGGWDRRAELYLPKDVRASVQTNAGSMSVRGLEGCELSIKTDRKSVV